MPFDFGVMLSYLNTIGKLPATDLAEASILAIFCTVRLVSALSANTSKVIDDQGLMLIPG